MNKIVDFMDRHILPIATKIGQQRHLLAIRNGFLAMFALTMLSSLCVLVQNFPSDAYKTWLTTTEVGMHLNNICSNVSWGTFSFMAIFSCFGIADSLWKSYGKKGLEGAFVAVAIFLALSPQTVSVKLGRLLNVTTAEGTAVDLASTLSPELLEASAQVSGGLSAGNFGAGSLFTAIIVALLSVEVLRYFYSKEQLKIKLPDSVPPAVSKSFEAMIPGMLTLIIFIVAGYFFKEACGGLYLNEVIAKVVQVPLQGLTNSLGSAIAIPFGNSLFWTLGLHGSQIMSPITSPLLTPLSAENMMLAQQGVADWSQYNVITGPFFFAYAWHGGSGATIGLLIAMVMGGKKVRQRNKAITSLAMGPSIFNINEPVIFGVPIVLNPIYMIPFILAPVLNSAIAYVMVDMGLVAPTIVQSVPWVTPPILYALIATGHWTGGALALFTFVLSIVIYLPFVQASVKMEEKQMLAKLDMEREINKESKAEVTKTEEVKEPEVPVLDKDEVKIMLACAGGMSTSLLAKKMEDYGKSIGYNCRVWAIGISSIPAETGNYDVLLLGPQVKHNFDELRGKADSDKPVEVIKSQDYGTMNAKAVFTRGIELIKEVESKA